MSRKRGRSGDETAQKSEFAPNVPKKQKTFNFLAYPRRKIAIQYFYLGWQHDGLVQQPNTQNTVEHHLMEALLKTHLIEDWSKCDISRCGRTDKGVSAFRQTTALTVRSCCLAENGVFWDDRTPEELKNQFKSKSEELPYIKMLNSVLPKSIRVFAWAPVPTAFSARFDCTRRTYKYAFARAGLDLDKMRDAAARLVGEHDFSNFCQLDMSEVRLRQSFVRSIFDVSVEEVSEARKELYSMVELTITGSGFLWHMIRYIVTVLHEIGRGNEQPELISELLDLRKYPSRPQYTLSSDTPLCLFDCGYRGIEWKIDEHVLKATIVGVQKQWAAYQSRSRMLENMLGELTAMTSTVDESKGLHEFVQDRPIPGNYKGAVGGAESRKNRGQTKMSVINDENGRPYKVHLCKTNIAQNNNKFYDMELLETSAGHDENYEVKLINGRVGYKGVTHGKTFGDLETAKHFFEQKFHEKTALKWEERDSEPVPNKYVVVELANNTKKEPVAPAEPEKKARGRKKKLAAEPPEEAEESVKQLMKCICDEDVHLGLLKQLKFNEEFGKPIDCLSLAQLENGFQILSTIETAIGGKKAALRSSTRSRSRPAGPPPSTTNVVHETNKYYSLIPHSFGFSVPPKIDSLARVQAERELLDALKGCIEAAQNVKDLKRTGSERNIYQRLYERLPCQLERVSREIAEKIGDCLKMRGPTHFFKLSLMDAWALRSEHDGRNVEVPEKRARRGKKVSCEPTKRLLWHGTRVTNVFSILMNGLEIPEGDRCGLMFGNGVYFANVPTKSANYCVPEASSRVFMLLCEVDVANPLILYESETDAAEQLVKHAKSSVYAAGKHTPRETVDIDGIPAFKSQIEEIPEETRLLYDEYVMFDKEKFKIKYVVEVKVDKLTAAEMME
ncbi:unnamed protein product [Caenorhabditis sp. 36 PRJEB53466]|nr:unnamed protein product [Caenorhabditis sp. 36 PRJEB53466]